MLWVGETAEPERVARVAALLGGALEDRADGPARDPQDRPDPGGLPRRTGRREEAPARLTAGSTARSRVRLPG